MTNEERFSKIDTFLDGIESYIREINDDKSTGFQDYMATTILSTNLRNMRETITRRGHYPLNPI